MALLDFYGETPAYLGGLLGEDELNRLKAQAQSQSNIGMATALLQAGAPSRTPGGGALAIAQGLQAGQDLYRKTLNQGLQEKMAGLQVQDMIRKRQEDEAVRKFLPQIMQPGQVTEQLTMYGQPTQGVIRDDYGNLMPGGGVLRTQQPSTINRQALQQLALAAPEQFAKLSASLKALQPEYKEVNGQLYEISPYGGTPTVVGGKAKEDLAGPVKQAMQVLGINKPFTDVTDQERSMIGQYIDRQESLKAPKVAVDLKDPTAVAKAQKDLVESWRTTVKDAGATEVSNRFRSLTAALEEAKKGNANADSAIIYNVAKMYDPTGAVQQGDLKTIIGNPSIPQQIQLSAQQLMKGGLFTPEMRTNLYNIAEATVKQRQAQLQPDLKTYKQLATQLGGTGDFIQDPYATVFSPKVEQNNLFDLGTAQSQAAEILRKRRGY